MAEKTAENGTFVVSLDFELFWGIFDTLQVEDYGQNVQAIHTVVPELLRIFNQYDVRATWATVGLLANPHKTPTSLPKYRDEKLSAFSWREKNAALIEEHPELISARALIKQIASTPGQELASHTFSHYYCNGVTNLEESFRADCVLQKEIFNEYVTEPASLVFPRNQVTNAALAIAKDTGITHFRGNEDSFLYRHGTVSPLPVRLLRLIDSYVNLTGHHTHRPVHEESLINVPSSRFLRPYSNRLARFEKYKLRRITKAMTKAAKRNEVFHLWWHPHNFGRNQEQNLEQLEHILKHFKTLQHEHGMCSKTMREITPAS